MGVRRIGAAALAAVLAMGLVACGDDGGDDDDVSLEGVEGSDDGSGSGNGSGTEDTEPDDTDSTDLSVPDFGNLDECLEIAGAYASLSLAFFGGALGGEDVDVEQVIGQVEDVRDEAPDDVAEAFDVALETYQEVFENLGGDLDAVDFLDPDTAEALEPLSSDEFNEANETVSAYLDEVCTQEN
jgi:hypothetical protein